MIGAPRSFGLQKLRSGKRDVGGESGREPGSARTHHQDRSHVRMHQSLDYHAVQTKARSFLGKRKRHAMLSLLLS